MLQDLQHRELNPYYIEPEAQAKEVLVRLLENSGHTFLSSKWLLACAEHKTPSECIQTYLESCKIAFQVIKKIQKNELSSLPDKSLCVLENHKVYAAEDLKLNIAAHQSPISIAVVLKQDPNEKNIKQIGLIEFWSKLHKSEWLTSALKLGFKNLKPVVYASILINFLALAGPFFSIQIYDRIIPNQAFSSMWLLAFGVVICLGFDHLLKHARHHLMEHAATITDSVCTKYLSSALMNVKTNTTDPSYLLQHLRSFEHLREIITGMFLLSIIDLPFMLIFLAVIAYIHPYFLLISLSVIGVTMFYVVATHKQIAKLGSVQLNMHRVSQTKWLDALQNLEGLQAHGVQQAYSSTLNQCQLESRLSSNITRRLIFQMSQKLYALQQGSWVITIALGTYLIVDKQMTVGGLIAVSMLTMRCFTPLQKLQNYLIQTHSAQAGFEDLDKFLTTANEKVDGQEKLDRIQEIELINASLLKPGKAAGSKIANDYLLQNVSFKLALGDRMGVIGPNGSGKTSLLRLLSGQYDLADGEFRINSLAKSNYNLSELGQRIGFAQQPPLIMQGTLRENITLKRPWVSTAQCWEIIEKTGLGNWVRSHPDGLNMTIESQGSNLSAGQKQLVSLCRALAGHPDLILLDEPTVCLDQSAESVLIEILKTLPSDTTLILTTHRLNLLACTNELALVHEAKIHAIGDKSTVLRAANALQKP